MPFVFIPFETKKITALEKADKEAGGYTSSVGDIFCNKDKQAYVSTVKQLLGHIQRGDIYEINYCIEFSAENTVIDPFRVYENLKTLTEAPFAGLYKYKDTWIICASPERFIRRKGDVLVTQPMKGTARRSANEKEDASLKISLAQSEKERTENVMAVDVARNDLSIVAEKGSVNTKELFGVQTFRNVHQMVSTVECKLKPGVTLDQVIEAAFPPASMTGAPKLKAVELIKKYELSPRGIYSGCLGYVDENGDFDLCVVIRTIFYNEKEKRVSFHVGSAITAACSPEEEWNECLLKAESLLKALGAKEASLHFINRKSRISVA